MTSKFDPKYGKGEYTIAVEDEIPWVDGNELVEQLQSVFESPRYKPPVLPAVALKLVEMARNPDSDIKKMRALIETEAMIAGRVLQVAQSPMFTRLEPIRSIEQAMLRLGFKTLTDLFLEQAMSVKVFRAPGFDVPMQTLRKHSMAMAHLARLVSRRTSCFDEYAFMCGLLHDIGAAAAIIVLAERMKKDKRPDFDLLWPSIFQIHERAALILAQIWKLPVELHFVLSSHHQFNKQGQNHPLVLVLHCAEHLANELGFGMYSEGDSWIALQAAKQLGLSESGLMAIADEAKPHLEHID